MTGDHSKTVAWLVGLADSPGDDGAAIASREVLSAGLNLARPGVSAVKLQKEQHAWSVMVLLAPRLYRLRGAVTAYLLVAGLLELLLEVADSVENGWVLGHELEVWLGEGLGFEVLCACLVGSNGLGLLGLLGGIVVCLRGHHGLLKGLSSERHHGGAGGEIFGSGANHCVYLGDANGFVCFGEEERKAT